MDQSLNRRKSSAMTRGGIVSRRLASDLPVSFRYTYCNEQPVDPAIFKQPSTRRPIFSVPGCAYGVVPSDVSVSVSERRKTAARRPRGAAGRHRAIARCRTSPQSGSFWPSLAATNAGLSVSITAGH